MEKSNKRNLGYYMRLWHGYAGYFLVGLVVVYSLSGLVLIYRDTDLLKEEISHEKTLSPNLTEKELGNALKLRAFKVESSDSNRFYFKNGSYDKTSGLAVYTTMELPSWLEKVTHLHKSRSGEAIHYFTTTFGFLLFFMAISSFWMFRPRTKAFYKGLYIAGAGIVATVILIFL